MSIGIIEDTIKGRIKVPMYMPRYYVYQFRRTKNQKCLDAAWAQWIKQTGILRHDDLVNSHVIRKRAPHTCISNDVYALL